MKTEWWKDFYDEHLADILLRPASGEESRRTSDFLRKTLNLAPQATVFDQCCGTGRIAIELAKHGHPVTGIDLAECYITDAQSQNTPLCSFAIADAFEYVTPSPCDAVINWWTSFGYSDSDEQNQKMLARAYESLVPGGRFAMDYMNVPNLYRNFKANLTTKQETPSGPLILHRASKIDFLTGRLYKRWTYNLPSGEIVEHDTATQLYTPNQLAHLFRSEGFSNIELFGDIDGSPLTLESPRCIIIGTKSTS